MFCCSRTITCHVFIDLRCRHSDEHLTLNQIVHRSAIPRPKVITLLARLIRFRVAGWEYRNQQFLFFLES